MGLSRSVFFIGLFLALSACMDARAQGKLAQGWNIELGTSAHVAGYGLVEWAEMDVSASFCVLVWYDLVSDLFHKVEGDREPRAT